LKNQTNIFNSKEKQNELLWL